MIDTFCCDEFTRAYQDDAILDTGSEYFIRGRDYGIDFGIAFCPFCGLSFFYARPDWEQKDERE